MKSIVLIAVFCLLVPSLATFTAAYIRTHDASFKVLQAYLESHGGYFEWEVGQACKHCARGTFATKDYKEGDIIAITPLPASIDLGSDDGDTAGPVFESMVLDPEWNKTYGVFWATQPTPEDIMCLETFTSPQIRLLQSPSLASVIKFFQAHSSAAFYNEGGVLDRVREASNGTVNPPFALYNHISAIITTRAFQFTNPVTKEDTTYLLPAMDLINHSTQTINVERQQNGSQIQLQAVKPIKAGEELLYEYDPNVVHRPDMSLLIYGFVADDEEEPRLAACDRAGFSEDDSFAATPLYDNVDEVEDVAAEEARAAALLQEVEAATTLEQDKALLAALRAGEGPVGTEGWTWKETEIIKFRVARKHALRRWVRQLRAKLGKDEL